MAPDLLPHNFGRDGLFSSRIDSLTTKTTSPALRKCGAQLGVADELSRLQSSMSLLKALVVDVDCSTRRSSITELEGIVRDLIYEVEDSLDELEDQHYKMMGRRINRWSNWKEALRNAFANRAWDAATRIIDVRGRADIANCQLKAFLGIVLDGDGNVEEDAPRKLQVEMPPPLEQPLVGREKESERLMQWLTDADGSDGGDDVSILPVVGMGGLGKTALVRSVVHEPKVLDYFQLRMWVSVSQNCNVKELTRQMLESLSAVTGEEYPDTANLDRLQTVLMDELRSKRFLLVLDDVWNEDRSRWEMFFAPLMSGLPGSKILVTTRSSKVSDAMGVIEPMFLPALSDESFWTFFKMCAFGSEDSEKFPGLELIGKKISERLKGLPLAAVTVGRHLNSKLEEKHWETILESDVWKLEQGPNDLVPVLELSYRYLPAHLKLCFSFCGLFPNDYVFDKLSLVQMWMAHDYIIPQGNSPIEDVGSEYFDDLLYKSFFQSHCDGYIMHPLLGDLARYISKDECFTVQDGMSESMIPTTVRHISVQAPNIKLEQFIDMCKNKKLRTLLFFGKFGDNVCRALDGVENESTSIRVLDFGHCNIEKLPDSIGKLKQLRYLDACGTRIRTLPRSFFSLYKLQVLKVLNGSFMHLPEVTKLINLRYIDVVNYYISQLEKAGGRTSFQELSHYGYVIEELENMTEHVHRFQRMELSGDTCFKLNNKRQVDDMSLKWASRMNACRGY